MAIMANSSATTGADPALLPLAFGLSGIGIAFITRIAPFTVDELLQADEIMILSTGSHCIAVSEIDGRPVGGRDADRLDRLQTAYQEWFDAQTAG